MKKRFLLLIFMIMILSLIQFVNADVWKVCFQYGEVQQFCNNYKPDFTCTIQTGCEKCVMFYNDTADCYVHGNWNDCLYVQGCTLSGNSTIDATPPVLTLVSPNPDNSSIFTSTSIPVTFNLNEPSDVYYLDLIHGRGREVKICDNCWGKDQKRRFKEGFNHLQFRAKDGMGYESFMEVTFRIDSKKPRINKVDPRRGFASGDFYVEFTELNPQKLIFTYGNAINGTKNHSVNLSSCFEPRRSRTGCNFNVDLSDYNVQDIEYFFTLYDIAGNMAQDRRPYKASVDVSDPDLLDYNYTIDGRYVYFNFVVSDPNFDVIEYMDLSEEPKRQRWRKLCSRLKDGLCSAKRSFKDGEHNLSIGIIDEAGNAVGIGIEFLIDSTDPRIYDFEPSRGDTSGDFFIEYLEENPINLTLFYGNDGINGRKQAAVDLGTCYDTERDRKGCDVSVDLVDYLGEEIEVWAYMEDIKGNNEETRHYELDVV